MYRYSHFTGCLLALLVSAHTLCGMVSRSDAALARQLERATIVVEGVVVGSGSFLNGQGAIQTRYSIRVKRPIKGKMPGFLNVVLPGGVVGTRADAVGCQPTLEIGQQSLMLLAEGHEGSFRPVAGSASVIASDRPHFERSQAELERLSRRLPPPVVDWSQGEPPQANEDPIVQTLSSSATNLLTSSGFGARFLQPDQGCPIPYRVDADALPTGISQSTAMSALSNALAAWEAVSSVQFEFQGFQSFGQSADTVVASDGVLRIQLHDLYNSIPSGSTLGVGGRSASINGAPADWTNGGQVFGNDFYRTTRGYVVLKHTQSVMQKPLTFEEVLCHEIGHALGMAHSTPNTPAATGTPPREAQMYYIAHDDGRGAAPTDWDTNVLHQVHPVANTPPYMFDRVMEIVTASPQPAVPGINEIDLAAYDLQGTTPSVTTTEASSNNGAWTASGTNLGYTASSVFDTGTGFDPESLDFYEIIYARCSDGVHQSPAIKTRVLTYRSDSEPSISDGIPDYWMIDNFGTPNGASASGDDDLDTLSNIEEYRSGMNPASAASAQRVSAQANGTVSWQGKAYELYELQGSTNSTDWFQLKTVLATNDTPGVTLDPSAQGVVIYRVLKVP